MKRTLLCAITALCTLTSIAQADGGWAQFKPGAYNKMKTTSTTEAAGMSIKTVSIMKTTLKELSATEATVEMETESSTVMNGNETKMPPQKTEMKLPLSAPTATPSVPPEMAALTSAAGDAKVSTSKETLTIAGKAIDCTVSSAEMEAGGNKTLTKSWISDSVPGAMVKSESTTTGGASAQITMELLEFDAKK